LEGYTGGKMTEEKLELTRKDLEEIAEMYYKNQHTREAEVLLLNAVAERFAESNPVFQKLWQDSKYAAPMRPELVLAEWQKYQDSLNRAHAQLQAESLDAAAFLKYLVGSGTRLTP
jgi:hypothetical protein